MNRIDRLIRETQRNRGNVAERIARQTLDLMQDRAQIITHWPATWGEDRLDHFDEHVTGPDGTEYHLGIGSSETNREKDEANYPDIYHLVILPGKSPEEIVPEVIALLGLEKPAGE